VGSHVAMDQPRHREQKGHVFELIKNIRLGMLGTVLFQKWQYILICCIYRVSQEERSVSWEVIMSVILSNIYIYIYMYIYMCVCVCVHV
jgi:hypothetical protein